MQTNSKLREALSAALEQVNKVYDILSRPCVCIEEARQGCREARGVLIPALAEPIRNCDLDEVAENPEAAWLNDEDNWDEWGSPKLCIEKWMLAPAPAKKGGKDE